MNQQASPFNIRPALESAHMIAVSSGYANLDKSSITINLALCLAQLGNKVCVFDADRRASERELVKGGAILQSMNNLLQGEIGIDALLAEGPAGIKIIPQTTEITEYSSLDEQQKKRLLQAITQLQHDYDYLLIDTSAGIQESTISALLGSGSIVITVTPDMSSLMEAFALLKGIKQRILQQPVNVLVNLVAGEAEAKRVIAWLSITVRRYLGLQCAGLSFFIIDDRMLNEMSQARLVMLEYPNSLPSECLKSIALHLTEPGQPESMMHFNQLSELDTNTVKREQLDVENFDGKPGWLSEAIHSVQTAPIESTGPIMKKLNEIWQQRKTLQSDKHLQPNFDELELLKLKTAVYFAGRSAADIDRP